MLVRMFRLPLLFLVFLLVAEEVEDLVLFLTQVLQLWMEGIHLS